MAEVWPKQWCAHISAVLRCKEDCPHISPLWQCCSQCTPSTTDNPNDSASISRAQLDVYSPVDHLPWSADNFQRSKWSLPMIAINTRKIVLQLEEKFILIDSHLFHSISQCNAFALFTSHFVQSLNIVKCEITHLRLYSGCNLQIDDMSSFVVNNQILIISGNLTVISPNIWTWIKICCNFANI